MIQALSAWIGLGTRRKTSELKNFVLEISSQMNEGQQKSTSRRNKEIRETGIFLYGEALGRGLSDAEAREEGWPSEKI